MSRLKKEIKEMRVRTLINWRNRIVQSPFSLGSYQRGILRSINKDLIRLLKIKPEELDYLY